MQIVIDDNRVVATHANGQGIAGLYPGCLILTVPDGTSVEIGQAWEIDLDAAKAAACDAIDAQAAAFLQDPTPTEAEYPDIFNEIGVTADSAAEVAAAVLAAAEKWRDYGRLVERARLAGKKAVQAAADVADIVAARDDVAWPRA